MSNASIFFSIMWVAMADIPGRTPMRLAMCIPGCPLRRLDVLETLRVDGVEAEEVKNRLASMPSALAPLAMIRPG